MEDTEKERYEAVKSKRIKAETIEVLEVQLIEVEREKEEAIRSTKEHLSVSSLRHNLTTLISTLASVKEQGYIFDEPRNHQP